MNSPKELRVVTSHQWWADLVRIIAICLVLLIHTFSVSVIQDASSALSLAFFTLAKTGVPLFVMLSGALLLPKSETTIVFLRKRIARVFVPWIFWAVILFLLTALPTLISPLLALAEFRHIFISQFSFLPMLFCLYFLIPIFKVLVQKGRPRDVWYAVGLWFCGICLLPFLRNSLAFPLFVDNGLVRQTVEYSGYLLLGWLLSEWQLTKIGKKTVVGIVFFFIVVATFLVGRSSELQLVFSSYISPFIVIASAGLFLLFISAENWLKNISQTWYQLIFLLSQASFGVYLVHPLIIKLLGNISNNWLHWLMTLIISFGVILGLKRIPQLKKVIG